MTTAAERLQGRLVRSLLASPVPVVRALAGRPLRNVYGAVLDPRAHLLSRMQRAARRPAYYEASVRRARRELELGMAVVDAPAPAGVTRTELRVDGGAGPRRAFVYTPEDPRTRASTNGGVAARPSVPRDGESSLRPALVYFHGGGFVVGTLEAYDQVCRSIAADANCVVISVDYRLAPEDRFPAATDDALAAFRFVASHAAELGVDPKRIAVGGDSAGGNLAAVACLRARDDGGARPCFQWLIYPAIDMTRALPSHRERAAGPFLDAPTIDWFVSNYLGGRDPRHPHASPLFATSHADLPPAHVVVAGFDPLRDEGLAYADTLSAAGVPVTRAHAMTLVHGFFAMTGVLPAAHRARAEAIDALSRALHG